MLAYMLRNSTKINCAVVGQFFYQKKNSSITAKGGYSSRISFGATGNNEKKVSGVAIC